MSWSSGACFVAKSEPGIVGSKHLYLTDEGASHLVALRRLEKRVVAHFEKKLGAQNLSKLIEWLGILAEND